MNAAATADHLEQNLTVLLSLFQTQTLAQLHWKPTPDVWNMIEVACHLLDEERQDFRDRIRRTLEQPNNTLPSIDPEAWAKSRDYANQDMVATLEDFRLERLDSLVWLRGLGDLDLQAPCQHATLVLHVGDLLASWVAHDLLHMRQLVRLQHQFVTRHAAPFHTLYAGDF